MEEFPDTNQPWLEQVYGSFNASRLDMRLFGRHPEEFHPDSTTVGAMATYVHEHMHYFQTLFTGFGHILWSGHRQATGYSVRIWKELASKGLGHRLPLAAYSDDPEGGPVALIADFTARDMARLSAARVNLPIPNWTFRELKTRLINTDWAINPVVELAGEKLCLQGKDILEGQAHFVERIQKTRLMRHVVSQDTLMSFDEFKKKFRKFNDEKIGDTWEILSDLSVAPIEYEHLAKKVLAAVTESGLDIRSANIPAPHTSLASEDSSASEPFSPVANRSTCEDASCGRSVTQNVVAYSRQHFAGKIYCMTCQKKHRS